MHYCITGLHFTLCASLSLSIIDSTLNSSCITFQYGFSLYIVPYSSLSIIVSDLNDNLNHQCTLPLSCSIGFNSSLYSVKSLHPFVLTARCTFGVLETLFPDVLS